MRTRTFPRSEWKSASGCTSPRISSGPSSPSPNCRPHRSWSPQNFPQSDLEKESVNLSCRTLVCFECYYHSVARLTDLQLEVNPLAFVSNLVDVLHQARH